MLAIIRMIVVLASICGLSGFALSYLKISTPRVLRSRCSPMCRGLRS